MNIVQVGCNDCQDSLKDYVYENHKQIKKLVLLDPNDTRILGCNDVYKDYDFELVVVPKAITTQNDDKLMLYLNPEETNGHHTSFNKEHLLAHNHPEHKIQTVQFPAININKLFEEHGQPDRLYVDTEGYDIDIIKSIDFTKWDIPYIKFEVVHSDGAFSYTTRKCVDFYDWLQGLGYKINKLGSDSEAYK
jgi:hypothetical protein